MLQAYTQKAYRSHTNSCSRELYAKSGSKIGEIAALQFCVAASPIRKGKKVALLPSNSADVLRPSISLETVFNLIGTSQISLVAKRLACKRPATVDTVAFSGITR